MSEAVAGARYAKALFELSEKENKLSEADAMLAGLAKAAAEHPEVMAIIRTPTLKQSEKSSFIEKLIPKDSPVLLKDFLKVLIDKKRFPLLDEIQVEFHELFEKNQGILEVELISAAPFSKTLLDRLKKALTTKLRSKPPSQEAGRGHPLTEIRLIAKTDAWLLGGFLLRFAGKEIDCSFRNRFHEIEQQLLTQEGTF